MENSQCTLKIRVYIDFKKSNSNSSIRFQISNEEKNFLIQENQSNERKKAKRSMFETIFEIMQVYPKIKNSSIAYSICFDQYEKHFSFIKDDEVCK